VRRLLVAMLLAVPLHVPSASNRSASGRETLETVPTKRRSPFS